MFFGLLTVPTTHLMFLLLKVYLHGGYDTTSSQNEPLRDIIVFNPTDLSVTKIQAKNVGPTR